jgi:hypothetical protein
VTHVLHVHLGSTVLVVSLNLPHVTLLLLEILAMLRIVIVTITLLLQTVLAVVPNIISPVAAVRPAFLVVHQLKDPLIFALELEVHRANLVNQ